jgi:predicted SPOUT superfamily RNA methylase MTH1
MNDQNVTLKLSLVNAVLQYLGTRPYQEVFPVIQELQAQVIPQLPVPEQKPADAPAAE